VKRRVLSTFTVIALLLGSIGTAYAGSYTVLPGDVLWKIAEKYGTTWQKLADFNKLADPDLIFPNQVINIPEAPTAPAPSATPEPQPAPADGAAVYDPEFADYFAEIDTAYAYNIGLELAENPLYESSSLGTRTAGSDAEHAAADFIAAEMKKIGLSGVEKVPVDVDKWQFNGASLAIAGIDKVISPHSYATASTPAAGITAEIVYAGDGTMWNYEDLDVKDKIVLIDIDQRANWWITYPMLEAQLKGAAAIISSNIGGFAQISKDALNCQDICGPVGIPCVSISVNDADNIKKLLEAGAVQATLKVDNTVEENGTSYNVMGMIPGKNHSEMIVVGSHYDKYFDGFQDNSMAVALDLAMAKAMIESGYVPERDIVFVAHAAEEWGASDTQFDWCTGAWRMINETHPEWVGKTLAFLNFELPAYEFANYTNAFSAPELYTMIRDFAETDNNSPEPEGCFKDGFLTDGYQTYTYSDDFSYYAAGVPSVINGFLLTADGGDVFPFYYERYHSQFDDSSTYNEAVFKFNLSFYGAMAMTIDRTPALELDFTSQYDRIAASLDETAAAEAGADVPAFKAALETYKAAAIANHENVAALNGKYEKMLASGASDAEIAALWKEAREMNAANLAIFERTQDAFLGLMYERPIVPHEAPQENIQLMRQCIDGLKAGDVNTVVDEYAWAVNNVLEWYNYSFSPEVIKTANDMFDPKLNKGNLFWGTDKMFTLANVEEATRSLYLKYDTTGSDFSAEIAIYEKAVADQQIIYRDLLEKEAVALDSLAKDMLDMK